jgi:hypothetical protein
MKKSIYLLLLIIFIMPAILLSYDVVLKNGKVVSGKLISEDQTTVVIIDATGVKVSFQKSALDLNATYKANETQSPKPSGEVQQSEIPGSDKESAPSGDLMTNQSVIDLVKLKTDDSLIIRLINQSHTQFDTSVKAILQMKRAGVSDAVLQAMVDRQSGGKQPNNAVPPNPEIVSTTTGLPTEIGVYVKKGDSWAEVDPEIVNWKTGGVFKHIASAGIVKGDVNGHLNGPHSRNSMETPIEFVIVAGEGVSITEYQLIRLRPQDQWREFRTVTGGVFHQSGGATRDMVDFEGTKIAPRTFRVTLQTLADGEYGFLPPSAFVSAGASSQLGKMYTFRIGATLN